MMGFQPVVLWTDLLLFGLLGCICWRLERPPQRAHACRLAAGGRERVG
jgi:hypothetical protein